MKSFYDQRLPSYVKNYAGKEFKAMKQASAGAKRARPAAKPGKAAELEALVRGMLAPCRAEPGNLRFLVMQADMRAAVVTRKFSFSAALGGVSEGAEQAWITSNDGSNGTSTWNLVSREYWAAWAPNRNWMVRAGRMNLPFGLRTEDHILDVRDDPEFDPRAPRIPVGEMTYLVRGSIIVKPDQMLVPAALGMWRKPHRALASGEGVTGASATADSTASSPTSCASRRQSPTACRCRPSRRGASSTIDGAAAPTAPRTAATR